MVYVKSNKDGLVIFLHTRPFDKKEGLGKTREELEQDGVILDCNIPKVEEGHEYSVLYYNEEKGLHYRYTKEPTIKELDERISEIEMALTELIGGVVI